MCGLTVFDQGCSTKLIYTGQCGHFAMVGRLRQPRSSLDTPPAITGLKLSPRREFKVATKGKKSRGGSKLKYTLTERAAVTFTVQHPTSGRLVGKSCKKKTKKNAKAKKCTLWVKDGKNLKQSGKASFKHAEVQRTTGIEGAEARKVPDLRCRD